MFGGHLLFEQIAIEWLRFAALFALDQCIAERFNLGVLCLVAADQITDVLAVVFDDDSVSIARTRSVTPLAVDQIA